MTNVGTYLEYREGYQDTCGDIISTMERDQYCVGYHHCYLSTVGGYHEYRGGVFSTVEALK